MRSAASFPKAGRADPPQPRKPGSKRCWPRGARLQSSLPGSALAPPGPAPDTHLRRLRDAGRTAPSPPAGTGRGAGKDLCWQRAGWTELEVHRGQGRRPNLHCPAQEQAAPGRSRAQRGNKGEPGWGGALPGCRVTGLLGKAPGPSRPSRIRLRARRRGSSAPRSPQSRVDRRPWTARPDGRPEAAAQRRTSSGECGDNDPGRVLPPPSRPGLARLPGRAIGSGAVRRGRSGRRDGMIHLGCGHARRDCRDAGRSAARLPNPAGSGLQGGGGSCSSPPSPVLCPRAGVRPAGRDPPTPRQRHHPPGPR